MIVQARWHPLEMRTTTQLDSKGFKAFDLKEGGYLHEVLFMAHFAVEFYCTGFEWIKDAAPSGFDQLVGKKFLLLVPVYKRAPTLVPGDPTIFDEEKDRSLKKV